MLAFENGGSKEVSREKEKKIWIFERTCNFTAIENACVYGELTLYKVY